MYNITQNREGELIEQIAELEELNDYQVSINKRLLIYNEEIKRLLIASEVKNINLMREASQYKQDITGLEKYIDYLQEGFIDATITKYAPLDPSSVEGFDYSGDPNITSTGSQVGIGTAAVDPSRIPYDTKFLVEGFDTVFTAKDTGGAMRSADGILIDLYTPTRSRAFEFGRQERRIFILGGD